MRLRLERWGVAFQNPVLLAAGTCGFGEELADVVRLEALGGFVTKSVTLEPRAGNPPPRLAETGPVMINSVGLANPGVRRVKAEKLPWIRAHAGRAQVFVSLAGRTAGEYARLVEELDGEDGFLGFELNLSCPNERGRRPFALDPDAVAEVVGAVRSRTGRPLLVKLAPNDPDLAGTVRRAEAAGADGLTLVNTLPGLALDSSAGRPLVGAGAGGLSGSALRGLGVLAVATARRASALPLVGAGGVACTRDALEYLRAGASLVQVGTQSFADPRAAERIVRGLGRWLRQRDIDSVEGLVRGTAAGPEAATGGIQT